MPEILEVEAARAVLEGRALGREIATVYAPDLWFLKRGTTPDAVTHALRGNEFTAARRRGKSMFLDTRTGTRLGLHLGMSGRVLVDDTKTTAQRPEGSGAGSRPLYIEAGDPLIYASNRRVPAWHRFGVEFDDGGALFLRDPRRLGAVELDPDESRLGPDALTLTLRQLDQALAQRTAPVKAVLMDQARVAGLGNLLTDEALWRAGIDPAREPRSLTDEDRRGVAQGDPLHVARARPPGRQPYRRPAARPAMQRAPRTAPRWSGARSVVAPRTRAPRTNASSKGASASPRVASASPREGGLSRPSSRCCGGRSSRRCPGRARSRRRRARARRT